MPCECTIYECLNVLSSNCDEIVLDLVADETGIWTMRYEFDEFWFQRDIDVTSGDPILIPNVFNEKYKHTIEFYDVEGEKFNDTCYTLDTSRLPLNSGSGNVPTPSNAVDYLAYIVVSGTPSDGLVDIGNGVMGKEIAEGTESFTDSRLIGKLVTSVETLNQTFTPNQFVKTQPSDTFTLTGITLFDTQVLILYVS